MGLDVYKNEIKEIYEGVKELTTEYSNMENYFESIGEKGERYEIVKYERIKGERLLWCLEDLLDLPEILLTKFASDAKINYLLKDKGKSTMAVGTKVVHSSMMDRIELDCLMQEEQQMVENISSMHDGDEKDEATNKAKECSEKIKEITSRIEKKEKEIEYYLGIIEKIKAISAEDFRKELIEELPYSEELLSLLEHYNGLSKDYEAFKSISSNPGKVKELIGLRRKLNETVNNQTRKRVYLTQEFIDTLHLPIELKNSIINNSNVFNTTDHEVIDPELGKKLSMEYLDQLDKDIEKYSDIIDYYIPFVARELGKLKKYKELRAKNGGKLDYGAKDNTPEVKDILEFFTYYHGGTFTDFTDVVGMHLINSIDVLFNCNLPLAQGIIFGRKDLYETKNRIIENQVEAFETIRQYIIDKLNECKTLPAHLTNLDILLSRLSDTDLISEELVNLKGRISRLSSKFDELAEELEDDKNSKKAEVDEILSKINDLAGCPIEDINLLLTYANDTDEDLAVDIYQKAAQFQAKEIIQNMEKEAKEISFMEEAQLRGVSPYELHVIKLEEERKNHKAELSRSIAKAKEDTATELRKVFAPSIKSQETT